MKPVKIKISCGNDCAEIEVATHKDGIGIELDIEGLTDSKESFAVYNVATLCLVGLGVPKDQVDQRMMNLC